MSRNDPNLEPPPARSWAGILPVLLLGGFGCILFGVRECRHGADDFEMAPPAVATNLAPRPMPPPPPPEPPPAIETPESAARKRYIQYRDQWQEGQFAAAADTWRAINAGLVGRDAQDAFWEQVLPASERITLTQATLCPGCTDGRCVACRGSGDCILCEGARHCPRCKGHSVRTDRCPYCVCRTCTGAGQCPTCRGSKLGVCANCAGGGGAARHRVIPCESCGGSGTRETLRRSNDSPSVRAACGVCRGSGRRSVSRFEACLVCGGKGRAACTTCAGSGDCTACRGQGHRPGCAHCRGEGILNHTCPDCEGVGRCTRCHGSGKCLACAGNEKCPTCKGAGAQRQWSLPAHRSWLALSQGYLVLTRQGELITGGRTTGLQHITALGREITLDIKPQEVIWLSERIVTDAPARAAMRLDP